MNLEHFFDPVKILNISNYKIMKGVNNPLAYWDIALIMNANFQEPWPLLFLLFNPEIILFVFGQKLVKKTTNTLVYWDITLTMNANFERYGQ
jgi:hypothetical protein